MISKSNIAESVNCGQTFKLHFRIIYGRVTQTCNKRTRLCQRHHQTISWLVWRIDVDYDNNDDKNNVGNYDDDDGDDDDDGAGGGEDDADDDEYDVAADADGEAADDDDGGGNDDDDYKTWEVCSGFWGKRKGMPSGDT